MQYDKRCDGRVQRKSLEPSVLVACVIYDRAFFIWTWDLFCLFFQQSICPGVALSKVLLAAQIPDKHEFTEFNSIARVSFTSLVANVVKIPV